jgi:hypothetical protein
MVAAGVCVDTDAEQPTAARTTIALSLRNPGGTAGDYTKRRRIVPLETLC